MSNIMLTMPQKKTSSMVKLKWHHGIYIIINDHLR